MNQDMQLHTPSAGAMLLGERELIISVFPDGWLHYEGTAAQLVFEGLIPADFVWPRSAANESWEANGFTYSLRRCRPADHKGPMRSWLELDNWFVRIDVSDRYVHWHARRRLELQAEKMRAAYHQLTVAGQRESDAKRARYWQAQRDKAFQAFKSIVVPAGQRPSRKPKSTAAIASGRA